MKANFYSKTPIELVSATWIPSEPVDVAQLSSELVKRFGGTDEGFAEIQSGSFPPFIVNRREEEDVIAAVKGARQIRMGDDYATIVLTANNITMVRPKPYPGWDRLRLRIEEVAHFLDADGARTCERVELHYYDELLLCFDESPVGEWFTHIPSIVRGRPFDRAFDFTHSESAGGAGETIEVNSGALRLAEVQDNFSHLYYFSAATTQETKNTPFRESLTHLDNLHGLQIDLFEEAIGEKFREYLR